MTVLLISFVFVVAFLSAIKKSKIELDTAIFFSFGYLLYCGFRDITSGEDSINYFNNYFLTAHNYNSILELLLSDDVFFKLINYFLLFFSSDLYFYASVMAVICLFLVIKINKTYFKLKKAYFFLALLVTNPIFIENTTNILRTTLCCLILMLGYLKYEQNKTKGFIITFIGFLTHYFQGTIILCLYILSRINIIRTKKHLTLFNISLLIILFLKTFTTIFYNKYISVFAESLNLYLSENNIINYTLKQMLSDKILISVNVFSQILLYVVCPLFLIKFEDLNLRHKKLLNLLVVTLSSYLLLSPQFILALRLMPICILAATYIFIIEMNKKKLIYVFSIIFFNCVLAIYNLN